jgi:hypothetical protein
MRAVPLLSACFLLPLVGAAEDGSDIAADGGINRGQKTEQQPDFVLEYDLERAFTKSPVWEDGPRLGLGIGSMDLSDFGQFRSVLDDDANEMFLVHLEWQGVARREMSSVGFYGSIGLALAQHVWEGTQGSDLEALTISPRVTAGYGFALRPWLMWELGFHFEYGAALADGFTYFGQGYDGGVDYCFAGGVDTGLYWSFNEGTGPELGLWAQYDYRRLRLQYENSASGDEFTDTASGNAWAVGAGFGFRF